MAPLFSHFNSCCANVTREVRERADASADASRCRLVSRILAVPDPGPEQGLGPAIPCSKFPEFPLHFGDSRGYINIHFG